MSKIVSGFAEKLLQIKMFMRFLPWICLGILCLQLLIIAGYNVWFNPLWIRTKDVLNEGMGMSWGALKEFKLGFAAQIFMSNLNGFYDLQTPVLIKSCWTWMLIPMIIFYIIFYDRQENDRREFIQGRKYISPGELNYLSHDFKMFTLFKSLKFRQSIPLGKELALPVKEEPKQTFIGGKPGSGKTNLFNQIIQKIRQRNQKAIIHDNKGDYTHYSSFCEFLKLLSDINKRFRLNIFVK